MPGIAAWKIYFQNSASYSPMTFKVFTPLSTKSAFKWLVNLPRAKMKGSGLVYDTDRLLENSFLAPNLVSMENKHSFWSKWLYGFLSSLSPLFILCRLRNTWTEK